MFVSLSFEGEEQLTLDLILFFNVKKSLSSFLWVWGSKRTRKNMKFSTIILTLNEKCSQSTEYPMHLFCKNCWISENLGLCSGSLLQHCLIRSNISFEQADMEGRLGKMWNPSEWNQCFRFSTTCYKIGNPWNFYSFCFLPVLI